MKSKLLLVALCLAFIFSGTVFAGEPFDNAPPARVLKAALNLSDEQTTALRELIETRVSDVKAIEEQINELQSQLEELLQTEEPDPAEVGGLVLDIHTLKQEIRQGHEDYQQSFRDLLTAMQLDRLEHINLLALADRAAEILHKLRLH